MMNEDEKEPDVDFRVREMRCNVFRNDVLALR